MTDGPSSLMRSDPGASTSFEMRLAAPQVVSVAGAWQSIGIATLGRSRPTPPGEPPQVLAEDEG